MRIAISAALVLGFALATGACGSSYTCEDLCNDANKCPGATQENCSTSCSDISNVNKAGNCTTTFDSFLSCVGDHKSLVCSTTAPTSGSPCYSEMYAYAGCIAGYCLAHTTDPACTQFGQ